MPFLLCLALAQDYGPADTGPIDTASQHSGWLDTGAPPAAPVGYPRPVAYWPLDEVDTVVADLAHDHEGLLSGAVATDGVAGPALAFGPTTTADLGDHLSRMTAGPDARFSMSLWLRPDVTEPGVLWSKASHPSVCVAPDVAAEMLVRLDDRGRVVVELFGASGELLRVRSAGPVPLGQWSHLVVTQDARVGSPADRVRLHLDGAPWSTDVLVARGGRFDLPDTDAPLSLGTQLDVDGAPCSTPSFQGGLDEASVFHTALRDDQIAALYTRTLEGASLLVDDDPLDLLFLIDTSGSMNYGSPLTGKAGADLALTAASQYLEANHGPQDTVTALLFNTAVSVWTPTTVVADDPDALFDQWSTFDQLSMTGTTNHAAAFAGARAELEQRADHGLFQAIVLITDGNHTSGTGLAQEVPALRDAGLHVWAIGFGTINHGAMAAYAQGFGTYEATPDSSGLAQVLIDIIDATP